MGVVTGRDLAVRVAAHGSNLESVPVSEIMSAPAVPADVEAEIEEALFLMRDNDIRRLVVINGEKRPVGVISLSDLVGTAPDESVAINLRRHADRCHGAELEIRFEVPGLFLG